MSEAKTTAAPTSKPLRILVIQLARLGDTLQSLMALRAAQQLYPQLEIHFLARETFADAAKRVPWIKQVITLPTNELLADVVSGKKKIEESLTPLARWLAPLTEKSWDMIVNWTFTEASSWLTAILPAHIKLGYSRRNDGSFSTLDGWSHYIQAVVQSEADQNIHLTDILTTQLLTALQIHVGDPTDDGNAAVTSKSFFKLELDERDAAFSRDPSRKWIGIQLGASQESKSYSPENWAKAAELILRRHSECNLVLLGGASDETRARKVLEFLRESGIDPRRTISLAGQTDFDLWASVVGRCQWLLTADTAAVHLASVLGTRVLNVSVGPVRWWETGPYGNGHYVVAPTAVEVPAEAVYATWAYASSEWSHRRQSSMDNHFSNLGYSGLVEQVRICRSKIRDTQNGGGVHYEPVLARPMSVKEWSSQVVGHIARAWYCGWTPAIGQELQRSAVRPDLVRELRELDESLTVMKKICEESMKTSLSLSARSIRLKSQKIMNLSDRQEIETLSQKLKDLDLLMGRLSNTKPLLGAFVRMQNVLMHNLRGSSITDLGKQSAEAYSQIGKGAVIFKDWIQHTLQLAKPIALRKSAEVIALDTKTTDS